MKEEKDNAVTKLFDAGQNWSMRACIIHRDDRWDAYARAFKDAGDELVKSIWGGYACLDRLIVPVCFLYRHYLEVRLKSIIIDGKRLLDEKGEYPRVHGLSSLWEEARALICKLFPDEDQSELVPVDDLIREFNEIDFSSFVFRYPEDKKGNESLADVDHINLADVHRHIANAEGILGGVACMLAEYLDCKMEMQRFTSE